MKDIDVFVWLWCVCDVVHACAMAMCLWLFVLLVQRAAYLRPALCAVLFVYRSWGSVDTISYVCLGSCVLNRARSSCNNTLIFM